MQLILIIARKETKKNECLFYLDCFIVMNGVLEMQLTVVDGTHNLRDVVINLGRSYHLRLFI